MKNTLCYILILGIYVICFAENFIVVWEKALSDTAVYDVVELLPNVYCVLGGVRSGESALLWVDGNGTILRQKSVGSFAGRHLTKTLDGGFAITGSITRPGGNSDIIIVKTDSQGSIQWQRTVDKDQFDEGVFINQRTDGSYVVFGNVESGAQSSVIIILLNANGSITNQKIYQSMRVDKVGVNPKGGYYLFGINADKAFVLKLDSLLNKTWEKTLFPDDCAGRVVGIATSDGGCLVASFFYITRPEMKQGSKVVKLNAVGEIEFEKKFYDFNVTCFTYLYHFSDVKETADGFVFAGVKAYIVCENINTPSVIIKQYYAGSVLKTNRLLSTLWEWIFDANLYEPPAMKITIPTCLITLQNRGYLLLANHLADEHHTGVRFVYGKIAKISETTGNRAPIAKAESISGQPTIMHPDVEYVVTAKYFDPDGRMDLKYCYLRLNHPQKPLTMMWYEATGHAAPWAGEEGANYLALVAATATRITEAGLEGYQITWRFKIKSTWPAVENAINFGVFAMDDAGLTSGWSFDNSRASFRAGPSLGTLNGRVTDKTTGRGLARVSVETEGGSTTTDDRGYYTLSLPPGTYTVRASAQGYAPASRSGVRVEANKTTTVNLALEPLPVITFEPYPFDLSTGVSVMAGGVRYVYYRLKDARGNVVPNAEVVLKWGESVSSSATGEVGIPLVSTRWGGPGTYTVEPVQEVRLGGQVCQVRNAPRLTLTVTPREWERHWEFGAGVSTSAGLTAYAKAQASAGLDFGLERGGAILLGRNFQAGVGGGVQVGPSFKLAGVIESQVGAMTELSFIFTGEETYRFPQGTTNLEEKKALATLLIFTFAQAAGTLTNPVVGALLEALWTSSSVYQTYLESQGVSFGVQASTSAGGEITVGFKEDGGSKAGLKLSVGPGLSFTAELVYFYYPKVKELGLRLQSAVDLQVNLFAVSTSVPVKLVGFEVRCDLSGSPKALVVILSDNRDEIRLRIDRGDLNKNGRDDVQEVLGQVVLLAALAAGVRGGGPSAAFLVHKLAEETKNFINLVNTIGGEYEIVDKSSRKNVEFRLEIELAWEVRIGLGGSLTFEEILEWVKERGAFRQGKVYPFEKYMADAYLAPDGRGLGDIVNAVTRGLWELAKDVVGRAVDTLKAGAEWVVETTAKTVEGVVVGTMTLVGRAGAVAKDTVVSIFSWVGRRVGVLKPGELTWLAEPRALNVPLPWEGLLVVGGFYKFEPEGLELAQPATLVLTYTDAVLPPWVSPHELDIYFWDPAQGGWQRLYATVDPDTRSLSAQVTRLGTFAIGLDLPPAPPQNLMAHATATSVFLSWESQGEADLLGFHVYRATQSGGPYQRLTSSPLAQTQYLDTDVVSGQVYYYVVTAVDAAGNESAYSSEVTVTAETVLFRADFSSLSGWQATGLWHLSQAACVECPLLKGSFAYYARTDTCTYEVLDRRGKSVRTQGKLTSPVISVPKNSQLTLTFDYFREVENNARSTLDRTEVQIRLGKVSGKRITWSGWRTVWGRSSKDSSPECKTATHTFSTRDYTYLQIQFVFNSVNGNNNRYRGWAVDNLVVKPAVSASPALLDVADLGEGWDVLDTADPEELQVMNVPNPVRDVRTTTFTVFGVEAEALRVEVYDLSGRLVWKAETSGNELVWHTEDLTGLPLANGVYLYLAYVKVDEEWIRLGPQKLVILR